METDLKDVQEESQRYLHEGPSSGRHGKQDETHEHEQEEEEEEEEEAEGSDSENLYDVDDEEVSQPCHPCDELRVMGGPDGVTDSP